LLPERVEADGSDPDDWLQTALDVVLPPPSRTVAGEKVLGDQASVAWVRNTGKPADGVCRAESGSWPRFYSVIDALRLSANVKPPKLPGGSGSTESFSLQRSTDQ
jgi:hypothetical protein